MDGLISVKYGFPPKPLMASDHHTLQQAGITNGEQIVVDKVALAPNNPNSPTQPLIPPSSHDIIDITKEQVQTREGVLVLREMKDDNSCLFRSIGYSPEI